MNREELIVAMLKSTIPYQLKQIDFHIEREAVVVWSTNSTFGTFHATNIIGMFDSFCSFLQYNQEEGRV